MKCASCGGKGRKQCPSCNGTGKRRRLSRVFEEGQETAPDCLFCDGTGKIDCLSCHGTGYRSEFFVRPVVPPVDIVRDMGSVVPPEIVRDIGRVEPLRTLPCVDVTPVIPRPTPSESTLAETASPSLRDWAPAVMFLFLAVLVAEVMAANYGLQRTLVATAGFFLFGGWMASLAASLVRTHESGRLGAIMGIGFGLCCGVMVAYLILTTPVGQTVTSWVIAERLRILGSVLALILGLAGLTALWKTLLK